jgi:hypothetical protein
VAGTGVKILEAGEMKKIICLWGCLLLLTAVPVLAKEKHKGGEHDRGEHRGEYESEHHGRKEGHHKDLPPGWQKKLNKGERVDDSLYVFMQPPPPEVIAVLPPPPPGVVYKKIEDKIVKINDINRQIFEVLELDKLPIPRPPKLPLPPLPPLPR